MLRTLSNNSYGAIGYGDVAGDNGNINEGSWRSEPQSPYVQPIQSRQAKDGSHDAEEVRSHFKGALLGLRQFIATERPLKLTKNAFYFASKALFVLKIFKFLS